jgi:branched-chain amino acid transport system substrate-binding protein
LLGTASRLAVVGRVYVSLPLRGPSARAGREVLRGVELAHANRATEVVVLDSSGADREAQAVANAKRAAADDAAVAYLGDFHSSQVHETAPILGAVDVVQVAPVATRADLRGPTLVRLMPHDGVGARAVAAWLAENGVREVLVVHDHDSDYGVPVGRMAVEAARDDGLAVRHRPVWDHDEDFTTDLGAAGAVLYVGVAGSGAVQMWTGLHGANPELWLLGSDGVAHQWLAHELDPSAASRTRFFVSPRGPLALYGFEAMALILDAVGQDGADRQGVLETIRATRDRDSVVGRYSLDGHGHTTLEYGRMAVVDRQLVWDLEAPP